MRQVDLQKRHYEFIAGILRSNSADDKLIEAFANALKGTNYLFNKEKFIAASKDS